MKSRFVSQPSALRSGKTAAQSISPQEFIAAVLRTHPDFAVFDCDGTLWDGDAGERFFDWELNRCVISAERTRAIRARYVDYLAGKVSEDDMCGEMVTLHQGLSESEVRSLAEQFFREHFVRRVFPEMLELVRRLQSQGCEVWAVSSTNHWVIHAAMKYFGIAEGKILAATVEVDAGTITDRLIRVPSGPGKPRAIQDIVKRLPDAAFGNSRWDVDMLSMAGKAYAINPNPDLEEIARKQGWTIYFPQASQAE